MSNPALELSSYFQDTKDNVMSEQEKPIEWITTNEAAEIMDVALSTVSRLCRQGELNCRQFGEGKRSIWQVDKASAEAYEKSVGGRPPEPRK